MAAGLLMATGAAIAGGIGWGLGDAAYNKGFRQLGTDCMDSSITKKIAMTLLLATVIGAIYMEIAYATTTDDTLSTLVQISNNVVSVIPVSFVGAIAYNIFMRKLITMPESSQGGGGAASLAPKRVP